MTDCVAVDVREPNLPNGRSIYDLITANNLDEIRSLLTPLTLRNRQSIVYQKVCNKTLLCHACELGFQDIVKYLLDECEADIEDCYFHLKQSISPMRVSINKLDLAMVILLMRRGAVAVDTNEAISCSHYAFNNGYYSLTSILRYYNNQIKHFNFISSETDETKSKVSRLPTAFSWITDFTLDVRSNNFLTATACGDINRMKHLLACGVNRKIKTDSEDNALCLAILRDERNAEHFLMNYRIFSLKEYVLAMELCGAKIITFQSNVAKGLRCWRKSLRIRNENYLGVSDKYQTRLETDLGFEFRTEEQLDRMQNNKGEVYIQALLVFLRLVSRFSQVVQNAFVTVAKHRVFHPDLFQPIKVLSELFEFPSRPLQGISSPTYRSIHTIVNLFRCHFVSDPCDQSDFLLKFGNLIDFMDGDKWKVLLRGAAEFYRVVYGQLLELVLGNIIAMQKFNLRKSDKVWIKDGIGSLLQCHSYPYPTTLLHKAIQGSSSYSVISFLLSCFADANCTDALKNTPMHITALLPQDNNYLSILVHLLIDAGGHIDSVNKFSMTPFKTLKSKGIIKNPLKFLSLQCLAAQTIHQYAIKVPELYPKILVRFIKLHSS